jgi:hypothetical protein
MAKKTPPAEIERALAGGAWLTSGQICTLVGRPRTTMWRRLQQPDMHWRPTPGGRTREYQPEDVRKLVDELRQVHGGESARAE